MMTIFVSDSTCVLIIDIYGFDAVLSSNISTKATWTEFHAYNVTTSISPTQEFH